MNDATRPQGQDATTVEPGLSGPASPPGPLGPTDAAGPASPEGSEGPEEAQGAPGAVAGSRHTLTARLWRAVRLHRLRLVRLPSSPHRIALGVGLGMFIGSIPLIPSQIVLAGVVAWLLRASPTAAAITTLYSNPVTCGPLYVIFFAIGSFLLPGIHVTLPEDVTDITSLLGMGWDVYLVLCAGGAVFGAVAGLAAYVVAHRTVTAYQQRRARWLTGARDAPPVVTGCAASAEGDGCASDSVSVEGAGDRQDDACVDADRPVGGHADEAERRLPGTVR